MDKNNVAVVYHNPLDNVPVSDGGRGVGRAGQTPDRQEQRGGRVSQPAGQRAGE